MDIHLSSAARNNLLSLKNTSMLSSRTQERLATGLKVNSALDNAGAFFNSRMLEGRANDYGNLLEDLGQVVQTVKTAVQGLESIETLLNAAKAKAQQARSTSLTDGTTRDAFKAEFDELRDQIQFLAGDAAYRGVNLLTGDSITAEFSIDDTSRELEINPAASSVDYSDISVATTASPGGLGVAAAGDWTTDNAGIDTALGEIDAALKAVRNQASTFGTAVSIVQNRIDFTENNINIIEEGAAKLILADTNEESANMLTLQTRQQLGTTALQLTSQAEQGILRLF